MKKLFQDQSQELQKVLVDLTHFHSQVEAVVRRLQEAFTNGHTAYVAGNGGSAAQAQHLSDELVGRYKTDRPPYPMVALTADGAVLTCIGNDFGYEQVFARQLYALGREGDVFIALSTSGTSANIMVACEVAKACGMTVIGLTGTQGRLREVADHIIEAPAVSTARIQELHLHAIHLMCEALELGVDSASHLAGAAGVPGEGRLPTA